MKIVSLRGALHAGISPFPGLILSDSPVVSNFKPGLRVADMSKFVINEIDI